MKKIYLKLTEQQKSTLSANTVHWVRNVIKKTNPKFVTEKGVRILFYKPNIKDY